MKDITRIALMVIASLLACGAYAQKAGDWIVSAGWAQISPNAKLDSISSTEPNANGAVQGASIKIGSAETTQFGMSYMFSDNIGTEFVFGIPPKLNLDLTVPSGAHPNALSAKALMPALVAKYHFGEATQTLRPFVGLGVSYLSFSDYAYNTADTTVVGLASQSMSIKSTWVPVFTLGASYKLNGNWSMIGSATYLPIKTEATMSGPGVGAGPTTTTASVKMDATILSLSLAYKF